jgi:ADP-ribose pyrophosphatase YjhB (NUDIX family)
MGKPVTPLCGADVFVTDSDGKVLLIQRADNGYWALPGGCQNLDDTPAECAVRECLEECGLQVRITHLLGVWSSLRYEYVNYPWKDNVFTHLVFAAEVVGGAEQTSEETTRIGWFAETELPPLSDGHEPRIRFGFEWKKDPGLAPFFE